MFRTSVAVADYNEELKTKEELLFAILHLAQKLKVDFAFPTTTLHIEQMTNKD